MGFILDLSRGEWNDLVTIIVVVIAYEMVNTSIETIVDMICPDHNKYAGLSKDLAAGAVLVPAIGAVIIGWNIFLPKIMALYF
jgi:diacylglycerol kinase